MIQNLLLSGGVASWSGHSLVASLKIITFNDVISVVHKNTLLFASCSFLMPKINKYDSVKGKI